MTVPPSMNFTNRILAHNGIVAASLGPNASPVLALKDQLLVCQEAEANVRKWLLEDFDVKLELITTLFNLLPNPHHIPDVGIYRLSSLPAHHDIFQVTASLKQHLKDMKEPGDVVSPNHVLVPASFGHSCPWGPPSPVGGAKKALPPAVLPAQQVTVIDSGYQWGGANWGANPLGSRVAQHLEAEQLPAAGNALGAAAWQPGIPDQPGEMVPAPPGAGLGAPSHRLVALAGHANFIAGVIAQHSPHAAITILNHNGAFNPTSDDFPTEATVARSLCRSADADVVNLGFAFATTDNAVSCVWRRTFQYIRQGLKVGPIVVAPAGNQDALNPHFPAALNFKYPGLFPEMVGVGSIGMAAGVPKRSAFTNHGKWVTCSALGSKVISTFLHVKMELEDGDTHVHDFTANSWASWSGTSFATPKVVAELCKKLAIDPDPIVAVKLLLLEGTTDQLHEVGQMLPQLG